MLKEPFALKKEKEIIQKKCLEDEVAFCTSACPFRLDVRSFIEKLRLGNFTAAYRIYRDAVGFPTIVAALCDAPCKEVCFLDNKSGVIDLKRLEEAAILYSEATSPQIYNIPRKEKRVAIIGAGPSGLACALKLLKKKYSVIVYEKNFSIGGGLKDHAEWVEEIQQQFMGEAWECILNTEISNLDDLQADAVYIATGKEGDCFGYSRRDVYNIFCTTKENVFMGGELLEVSPVEAIAHGIRVSNYIESYLKTGNTAYSDEKQKNCLNIKSSLTEFAAPVIPKGDFFTQQEAKQEAFRCISCHCNDCQCEFMRYYKKKPARISADASATAGADGLKGEIKVATQLISSCNLCGACKERCPEEIDLEAFLLHARIAMHKKGAIPWAYNDFFLQDMAHANSSECCVRISCQTQKLQYLFFPGCQTGASDFRYVTQSYEFLCQRLPDIGIMTDCCGAPSLWAGDLEGYKENVAKIKTYWYDKGMPELIVACPTCKKMLKGEIPEMSISFLYEFLAKTPQWKGLVLNEPLSVFDACSARHEHTLLLAVRQISKQAGRLVALPREMEDADCCGWGGHPLIANPEYTSQVVEQRISQNSNAFVTYCVNCRDMFASQGKLTYHVLDLFFGLNKDIRKAPTVTQRWRNREEVAQLLRQNRKGVLPKTICLEIEENLKQKLNQNMILEDWVIETVEFCEDSGHKMIQAQTGHIFGYKQIGYSTYWVEYIQTKKGIRVVNAYGHRMKIETGAENHG